MKSITHSSFYRRAFLGSAVALLGAGLLAASVNTLKLSDSGLILKHDSQPVDRGPMESASFAGIVKRVAPSVVKITVQMNSHRVSLNGGPDGFPGFNDPMFRQFFGNRLPPAMEAPESGLGSGVIISSDGYIVTNNHVVDDAKEVTVTLADGRDLTAKVIGRDPQTDIAVIKVSARDLPAITFAASAKVEVGDRVLAIGNPFGIGETVTTGIVSATGRRPGLGLAYEDFIQTDAAINPGNSGGALVDVDGRLLGINTAILSRSGGFQGVGLAVPSDLVSNVVDNLAAHGKVVRGYLGIGIQDLTPALAEAFGLSKAGGALISDVRPGDPGARAGLKSGDVVTALNGKPVESAGSLSLAVSETAPGTRLTLDVVRNGKTEQISVTTVSKPAGDRGTGDESTVAPGSDQGVLNGVGVSDLDADSRRNLDIPDRLSGALVTNVDPASAAARAGLSQGDVILEINRHPVDSAQKAVDLSANASNRRTLLKIWSHGNTAFLTVDETDSGEAN